MKDMIFVSHATPEDNDFTYWIVSQLAQLGYPVWCDLTKLLGGEIFWEDSEQAIRQRTIKFLYVLSKASNNKNGPLMELRVAHNVSRCEQLRDFIVPLWIDDLSPQQFNIEISRINAVPFNEGWEKGLRLLVKKLEKDNVPKKQNFTPDSVSSWWQNYLASQVIIKQESEIYLSNRFEISCLPETIFFHSYDPPQSIFSSGEAEFIFPAWRFKGYLITFAPIKDFKTFTDKRGCIAPSHGYSLSNFIETDIAQNITRGFHPKKILSVLLRIAWEAMIKAKGLTTFQLSNQNTCAFFRKGLVEKDSVTFDLPGRGKRHRAIVGHKTVFDQTTKQKTIRYWHFGIQARPRQMPIPAYIVKPHIIFTNDGKTAWLDSKRMHVARRGQCKDWWNDDWRDRILATMRWLAGTAPYIELPLGSGISLKVNSVPLAFDSPVSFEDPSPSVATKIDEDMAEDEFEESLVDGSMISDEQPD